MPRQKPEPTTSSSIGRDIMEEMAEAESIQGHLETLGRNLHALQLNYPNSEGEACYFKVAPSEEAHRAILMALQYIGLANLCVEAALSHRKQIPVGPADR